MKKNIDAEAESRFYKLTLENKTPPYFKLFYFQKGLEKIPLFLRSLLVGPILYILFYTAAVIVVGSVPDGARTAMLLLSATAGSSVVLSTNAYQRSLETMTYIARMLTTKEQLSVLQRDMCNMLVKPAQTWFSLLFASIITMALISIGMDLPKKFVL